VRIAFAALLALVALSSAADAQNVLFHEDFESGYSRWTMTDLWNAQDSSESCTQVAVPFPSGSHCAWYGSPTTCSFVNGNFDFQYLTCINTIPLPATSGVLELRFRSFSSGEDDGIWDTRKPQISGDGGATWTSITTVLSSNRWLSERFDVSQYAGQTVRLRFEFWIGDWSGNDFLGWLVDDVQIVEQPGPAVEQCYGDGTWYACPCANSGAPGRGCASSFNGSGARLSASGVASLAADTLSFAADGMSAADATIFQGANFQNFGFFTFAGDGISCVGSPYVRIRTMPAPGGALTYPGPGDASISVRGNVTVPWTTRYYGVRYRNASAFCTPATFNMTNTLQVRWRP
jgi:hypothetical protein